MKTVIKHNIDNVPLSMVNESEDFFFEKAENDLLRAALKRSYKERFFVMTQLMKRSIMFKNAKITCKPYNQ